VALTGTQGDRVFQNVPLPENAYVLTTRESGSVQVDGPPITGVKLPPSFQFGDPAHGIWTPLKNDAPVERGDVLRMSYKLKIPFLENWQSGALLSKLQKDDRFRIRYFALNEEIDTLQIEAEVTGVFKNNPAPVVAVLVAGAIVAVAVGVGVWLAATSVEKLGTLDFSEVSQGKINITALLVGGVILFFILGAYKGARAS
jgi:hypothetical protein